MADEPLLETVRNAVNAEHLRPLTDQVQVQSGGIVEYQIQATLTFLAGPGEEVVLDEIRQQITFYTQA